MEQPTKKRSFSDTIKTFVRRTSRGSSLSSVSSLRDEVKALEISEKLDLNEITQSKTDDSSQKRTDVEGNHTLITF